MHACLFSFFFFLVRGGGGGLVLQALEFAHDRGARKNPMPTL